MKYRAHRPHVASLQRGLTLIELMIVIAIVGILTAIAVPGYREHLRKGAIEDGLATMSNGRTAYEQYFLDNRTYDGMTCPSGTTEFTMSCVDDATTYTLTATGTGKVSGFVYTVNQAGARATTSGAWGTGACWITRKGQTC